MNGLIGDTESWGLLAGVLAPVAIAVIEQPGWSRSARAVVAWILAVLCGLLVCLASGAILHAPTVLRTVALVLVAAQGTHAGWKAMGVTGAVERVTSPGGTRP